MSFVDAYLERVGSNPDPLPEEMKKNLDALEQKLNEKMQEHQGNFDEALKQYGPEIADLVGRVSAGIKNAKLSFGMVRWVINIAIEVYQIVDKMYDSQVKPDMTPDQLHQMKVDFGKDLTYFVWMTVDPLGKYCNWILFKRTIEKLVVKWLAGYALNATVDLLAANKKVSVMDVGDNGSIARYDAPFVGNLRAVP